MKNFSDVGSLSYNGSNNSSISSSSSRFVQQYELALVVIQVDLENLNR